MYPARIILAILCSTWLLISQVEFLPAAQAQDALWSQIGQKETYIFYLRPTVYKNYLDFPGPSANPSLPLPLPIVKVAISYAYVKSADVGEEIPYESLWYRGADPLGCRRYKDFNTDLNYKVYVYLNSCSSTEQAACANALVRLYLEMMLNRHQVVAIEVPGHGFWDLVGQLELENFYIPSKLLTPPTIHHTLFLIDSVSDKQALIYYKAD